MLYRTMKCRRILMPSFANNFMMHLFIACNWFLQTVIHVVGLIECTVQKTWLLLGYRPGGRLLTTKENIEPHPNHYLFLLRFVGKVTEVIPIWRNGKYQLFKVVLCFYKPLSFIRYLKWRKYKFKWFILPI